MCGRFALYTDPLALAKHFQAGNVPELRPSYNVAPSQTIPIVRNEHDQRQFAMTRWGLIPSWAKEVNTGYNMINARADFMAEKPSFRSAFKHKRCLIPADGLIEWQELANKVKQPWYITTKDRQPMAFAGLWEHWQGADARDTSIRAVGCLVGQPHDRQGNPPSHADPIPIKRDASLSCQHPGQQREEQHEGMHRTDLNAVIDFFRKPK